MPIELYSVEGSPPCGLVLLVAAALDVELDIKPVNLQAGKHFTPEYLKRNPQHTVPTIVDNGFSVWESRAISRYLVNKYGKGSKLYPEDPKARAIIDQRLDFDLGTLYSRFADYFFPQIFAGAAADEARFKKLEDSLKVLDTFLEGQKYAAGSELTLADLSLAVTVSSLESSDISIESYPNIVRWYELVKSTAPKYEETNGKNANAFGAAVKHLLKPKTEA